MRSLAFQDHLLTVGCGSGEVLTYDTRNEKYLGSLSSPAKLVPRQGYMVGCLVNFMHACVYVCVCGGGGGGCACVCVVCASMHM